MEKKKQQKRQQSKEIKAQIKKQNKENKNIFRERIDFKLTITLVFICCFGLLMVYSASAYECSLNSKINYDSAYLMKKQAQFMLLGVVAILILRVNDYHRFIKLAIPCYGIGIASILLVLTPLGWASHGAKRWLDLGFTQFQVAELVKITTIIFLAYLVHKYYRARGSWLVTCYIWVAGGVPAMMILVLTDDLSSAIVILGITFCTSFVCMRTYKMHGIVFALVVVIAVGYVLSIYKNLPPPEALGDRNFRVGRIAAFLAPERYAEDQGFQVLQSLYAVTSGGIFGKGLGNSTQKLNKLPEAQNDMIFSVICEELGLFGAVILIGLLIYLCFHVVKIAHSSRDAFGSVIAMGIFVHIGLQSFINIAVNVNFMPNTGIGLPFISYGGTAILCQLAEMGLVYSIERNNRLHAANRVIAQERIERMNRERR